MVYKALEIKYIDSVIPLYIEYYNTADGSCWTYDTVFKRIHQVVSREDSYCLLLENEETIIGFAIGYFEQYDDIAAYDLIEIVIASEFQNKGVGTEFMLELESQVKKAGASLIQLTAENDEMHEHFYGKLGYKKANNLVLMSKVI